VSGAPTVIGLACSPRKGGNTDLMLDAALAGASGAGASGEKIYVAGLDIHPCRACNACFKTGKCIQRDDMQQLYPKLLDSDAVILSAPIFSMNLAAQAKILIDRLQCMYATKYVLKRHTVEDEALRARRRGLWLSAAGLERPDVFDHALPTVTYFFAMLEIKDRRRLTFHPVEDKGDIEKVPGALEQCREAGAALVNG